MSNVVQIRVVASADSSLRRVFRPLEEGAEQARRRSGAAGDEQRRQAEKNANYIARVKSASMLAEQRAEERAQKQSARQQEAAAQSRRRTEEKMARESAKEQQKLARDSLRETERRAQQEMREAKRAADERLRTEERNANYLARVKSASLLNEQRAEERAERESRARSERQARAKDKLVRRFGREVGNGLGNLANRVIGFGGQLASGAGIDFSPAGMMAREMELEKQAIITTNTGFQAKGKVATKADVENTQASIRNAGDSTKRGYGETAAALDAFVGQSGDLETGKKMLEQLGHYANATGADFTDLAKNAGTLAATMGDVPNKAEAVAAALRLTTKQAADGTVEFRDLAKYMPRLAGATKGYAGKYEDNFGELGVITQEAMKGGRTGAAEATNTAQSLSRDLSKDATRKRLEKAGINIWADEKHTQLISPEKIILAMLAKTQGSKTELAKIMPNQVSRAAVESFLPLYLEAERKKKGSGLDAVHNRFEEQKKKINEEDMLSAAKLYEDSTAGKAQGIQNGMDRKFGMTFEQVMKDPSNAVGNLASMFSGGNLGNMLGEFGPLAMLGLGGGGGGAPNLNTIAAITITAAAVTIIDQGQKAIDKDVADKSKADTENAQKHTMRGIEMDRIGRKISGGIASDEDITNLRGKEREVTDEVRSGEREMYMRQIAVQAPMAVGGAIGGLGMLANAVTGNFSTAYVDAPGEVGRSKQDLTEINALINKSDNKGTKLENSSDITGPIVTAILSLGSYLTAGGVPRVDGSSRTGGVMVDGVRN